MGLRRFLQAFERFFNDRLSFDVMLQRVKEMMRQLPSEMAAVIKFNCLTGLRPAEAVESVRLINERDAFERYYSPKRQTLEHYRFPDVFLRQTKKAYISFIKIDNLQPIANLGRKTPTWNDIRLACYSKGLNMDMRFCRRIFASHLSAYGIQSEVIDFLQGRVSTSVFSRHYLTPSNDLKERVLQAVYQLQKVIEH